MFAVKEVDDYRARYDFAGILKGGALTKDGHTKPKYFAKQNLITDIQKKKDKVVGKTDKKINLL